MGAAEHGRQLVAAFDTSGLIRCGVRPRTAPSAALALAAGDHPDAAQAAADDHPVAAAALPAAALAARALVELSMHALCVIRSRSFDLWELATALPCLSPCLLTQRSTDGHLSA